MNFSCQHEKWLDLRVLQQILKMIWDNVHIKHARPVPTQDKTIIMPQALVWTHNEKTIDREQYKEVDPD